MYWRGVAWDVKQCQLGFPVGHAHQVGRLKPIDAQQADVQVRVLHGSLFKVLDRQLGPILLRHRPQRTLGECGLGRAKGPFQALQIDGFDKGDFTQCRIRVGVFVPKPIKGFLIHVGPVCIPD